MSTRHLGVRAAIVLIVALCCALLVPIRAGADVDPGRAALGGTRVDAESVTTTLTVRSATGPIDPATVRVRLGNTSATATTSDGTNIPRSTVLAIDTSGSMGESGMAIVRQATRDFLAEVPADVRIGVVSFADTAGVDLEPTTDHAAVLDWVDGLTSFGYTSLYDGILTAVDALGTEGERSIILLSDGGDTVAERDGGTEAEAEQRSAATAALREAGIRVEAVAFKDSNEARDEVVAAFADAGSGSVADANDGAAVAEAFRAAAQALSSQVVVTIERPPGLTGSQPLTVTGTAGDVPFQAATTVDLGATAPSPTETSAPERTEDTGGATGRDEANRGSVQVGWFQSSLLALAAAAGIFLAILLLVIAVVSPVFRSRKSERLEAIDAYRLGMPTGSRSSRAAPSTISERLMAAGDRYMQGREKSSRTLLLIERADLPLRPGEWLGVRIVSVLLLGVLGYVVFSGASGLVGLLIGGLVGLALPAVYLRVRASRRATRFESLLPDVMMLIATSLSSGFSLNQALDAVAKDAAEPANKEFSRALAQARIGSDVADALDTVATRMDSENLRWTTMAIRIQREVGGNLADTLRTTATTLREREYLKRQVRTLSAEGRLSAYILIALPIALALYMMLVNYDYISLLWTTPFGMVMLVFAFLFMAAGVAWMRKIVQIEV